MATIPALHGWLSWLLSRFLSKGQPDRARRSNRYVQPFSLLLSLTTMKIFLLFIIVVPLLIGYLAGKSKSELGPLATMAGLLILFILYLVFIDKEPKEKQTQQPSPSSAQSAACDAACIRNDYSARYEKKRSAQHAGGDAVYICDPAAEYPY